MSQILHFTDSNFQAEVLDSDRPVLVDFWAAWCGPCRAVAPAIEQLARRYAGTAKVGKLNVDENPEAAERFAIRSIPAVLLFQGGKVVETLIGVQPPKRYEQAMDALLATP